MKSENSKNTMNTSERQSDAELILEKSKTQIPRKGDKMPIQFVFQILYYMELEMNGSYDLTAFYSDYGKKIKNDLIDHSRSVSRMFLLTNANEKEGHIGIIRMKPDLDKKKLKDIFTKQKEFANTSSKTFDDCLINALGMPAKNAKLEDRGIVKKYISDETIDYYKYKIKNSRPEEAFAEMIDDAFDVDTETRNRKTRDIKNELTAEKSETECFSDTSEKATNLLCFPDDNVAMLQQILDALKDIRRSIDSLQSSEKTCAGNYHDLKDHQGEVNVTYKDGSTYKGGWKYGNRHGTGKYTSADGNEEYVGDWICDLREGRGRFLTKDGEYNGEWRNDRINGQGTLKLFDGLTFSGKWKDGELIEGEMTRRGKLFYSGEWKNELPEGKGRFILSDGTTLEGTFTHMDLDGYGSVTTPDGLIIEGIWKAPDVSISENENAWHPSELVRKISVTVPDSDGEYSLVKFDDSGNFEKIVEYDVNGMVKNVHVHKNLARRVVDIIMRRGYVK